jgi:hypothetical protein
VEDGDAFREVRAVAHGWVAWCCPVLRGYDSVLLAYCTIVISIA